MKAGLKIWLEARAQVIENYLNDEKTDRKILAQTLTYLLLRLFKKSYVNFVLNYLNIGSMPEFKERLADKLGNEAADKIIKAIEANYKEKTAKK